MRDMSSDERPQTLLKQVHDAGKLPGTEPYNSNTLQSSSLANPANSAEPVPTASIRGQRDVNSTLVNEPGTNARLMAPAKPNSNGSDHVNLAARAKATEPEVKQQSAAPPAKAPIKPEVTQEAAAPATGSAALLARIRAQRNASSKGAAAGTPSANGTAPSQLQDVIVAYASQTGTAHEIARNIQAESSKHGIQSKVLSFNELGMDSLIKPKKQIVVMVVSSTGEGDPPDNSARFYGHSKRRSLAQNALKHIHFTCLGLGDSNYTRYMGVPRAFKGRFSELGAQVFYPHMEADEVDGLEEFVDKWIAGLWKPLKQAALGTTQSEASADAATDSAVTSGNAAVSQAAGTASSPPELPTANGHTPSANGLTPAAQKAIPKGQDLATPPGAAPLKGVPALPECRVKLVIEADKAAASQIRQAELQHPSRVEAEYRDAEGMYSPEQPFWAVLSGARALSSRESDRQVLHVEVDIEGSGMQYQPGDSIGILPHNDAQLVEGVLRHLGQDGDQVFSIACSSGDDAKLLQHLGWPCSLRRALTVGCDLTSIPRKSLLRVLGEHCTSDSDKQRLLHLSSTGGRQDYTTHIKAAQPSLLSLFHQFPSCKPPLASLLDCLPQLAPRMYSVSSSPLESPHRVHVAFSVVRYETPAGVRQGVATTWLEKLCQPMLEGRGVTNEDRVRLPVYLRRGGSFGLPVHTESGLPNLAAPMLMIGPGTGVAPFRGFLQQRRHLAKQQDSPAAPAWLYFGCRQEQEDFLYEADLKAFEADGTLSKLRVAFSRAQSSKVYVQHLLKQDAQQVFDLLRHPAVHVYVCGDGASMAKDVQSTLVGILESVGGLTTADASAVLAALTKQQRYIRDIWS
ncbi:hypothetical protein ABBQ38_013862 [Trebouxia sp. C0009 RCD-2024]